MASTIDKQALAEFIELLEDNAHSYISFERAVQVMNDVGFACRLACQSEHWNQSVMFVAPPTTLVPVEAEIETPFGTQHVTLEPCMSMPQQVQRALDEMRHVVEMVKRREGDGAEIAQREKLVERARAIEEELVEGTVRLRRSGLFRWPMDRFQLLISYGDREALVTIQGPLMVMLARGSLADETQPGIGVRDIAAATVKLLMERTIDPGRSVGAGFRARAEGAQLAELLRQYLVSLS